MALTLLVVSSSLGKLDKLALALDWLCHPTSRAWQIASVNSIAAEASSRKVGLANCFREI